MSQGLIAQASITIKAPISKVWKALVTPQTIKEYMFGTEAVSDWEKGSAIIWKGQWKGKPYQDKGVILKKIPERTLQYSHFSALSKLPDVPENYHIVTYDLSVEGDHTLVWLSQNKNASMQEKEEAAQMWEKMLVALKQVVETNKSKTTHLNKKNRV